MRIYEINVWPWLSELTDRYGRQVTLASIPETEWDNLQSYRFDAVWLMGVWQRSQLGCDIARQHDQVMSACASVYPGFVPSRDIVGSPYSIMSYTVAEELGGQTGLAVARQQMRNHGFKLILDFVPNHTGPDHDWISLHPYFYLQANIEDAEREPQRFFKSNNKSVFAYGAPSSNSSDVWTDTVQLNAFKVEYRAAAVKTLNDIADQCDGVRCDMAMLLLNDIFSNNWASFTGTIPSKEFWDEVIGSVRRQHPELIFIAETYSDTEWILQQQGFDYCYDKDKLYERLARGTAQAVYQHLQWSSPEYLRHLIHFIENHDEGLAIDVFMPRERHWMAAIAIATLPGASLWHDGQFEGRWGKQLVQLGKPVSLRQFYRRLLTVTDRPAIRSGDWAMCSVDGSQTMLAWCWEKDDDRLLIVLNMSEEEHRWGHLAVPLESLRGRQWKLCNLLTDEQFSPRDGTDMVEGRLHIKPRIWQADIFEIVPL